MVINYSEILIYLDVVSSTNPNIDKTNPLVARTLSEGSNCGVFGYDCFGPRHYPLLLLLTLHI